MGADFTKSSCNQVAGKLGSKLLSGFVLQNAPHDDACGKSSSAQHSADIFGKKLILVSTGPKSSD
jgi:hypothetical protein